MSTPRTCTRCQAAIVPPSAEHTCTDVARRWAKRHKQAQAVDDLLKRALPGMLYNDDRQALAEAIVATLANLGIDQDV